MSSYPTLRIYGDRGREWSYILGAKEIPILEPHLTYCSLGSDPGEHACYLLAVEALTPMQKKNLIDALAEKFNAPREEVEKDVLTIGVPIRAGDDVRVQVPPGWKPRAEGSTPGMVFDLRMFT